MNKSLSLKVGDEELVGVWESWEDGMAVRVGALNRLGRKSCNVWVSPSLSERVPEGTGIVDGAAFEALGVM